MSTVPQRPRRQRPSAWWFSLGAGLLVLALASFVVGLIWTISSAAKTDGTFNADGTPASVTAPAHEKRMLFVEDRSDDFGDDFDEFPHEVGPEEPDCTVSDSSGERDLDDVNGKVRVNQWRGIATFDSGDGDLTITCIGDPGTEMRVGAPLGFAFVGGLLLTVLGPIVLGGLGVIALLVTTILYATGAPRTRRT
jgi:hypothetical protein